MQTEGYSVSDIVERLCRAGDIQDRTPILRMVRYWVNEGVVRPNGPVHTGRGRDRMFASQEILRAALIFEMSKWHLVVGTMKVLMDGIDQEAERRTAGELLALIDIESATYFRFSTWGYPRHYMLLTDLRPFPPQVRSELYINARKLKADLGL
jgi:hypothetical protein